jgi:hypothetical protein
MNYPLDLLLEDPIDITPGTSDIVSNTSNSNGLVNLWMVNVFELKVSDGRRRCPKLPCMRLLDFNPGPAMHDVVLYCSVLIMLFPSFLVRSTGSC